MVFVVFSSSSIHLSAIVAVAVAVAVAARPPIPTVVKAHPNHSKDFRWGLWDSVQPKTRSEKSMMSGVCNPPFASFGAMIYGGCQSSNRRAAPLLERFRCGALELHKAWRIRQFPLHWDSASHGYHMKKVPDGRNIAYKPFRLVVEFCGTCVQRASRQKRETKNIADLVRVLRSTVGDDCAGPYRLGFLRQGRRNRIGQRSGRSHGQHRSSVADHSHLVTSYSYSGHAWRICQGQVSLCSEYLGGQNLQLS